MKRLILTLFVFKLAGFFAIWSNCFPAKGERDVAVSSSVHKTDTLNKPLPLKIVPFNLEIIPPSNGIQFYRNGIIFLSHTKAEDRMISEHVSFGTLGTYYTDPLDTILRENHVFSSNDPFAVPSEAMTFNRDYTLMFYAKRTKGSDSEKIYQADYVSGRGGKSEWISRKDPLSFCNDNSTYTHPALSPSGEFLVFASNKRGSSGGLDLYVTHKTGDSWSSPENLGKSVNTSGNELFPFLDNENNLYFSSDGHKGIGGYDLYYSRYNGKYWDKPVNLTSFINTTDDELTIKINPVNPTIGFMSVRKNTGSKLLKLFKITFSDQYSLNRFAHLSNALKFVAGVDFTRFEIPGGESSTVAQTNLTQAETGKPYLKQPSGKAASQAAEPGIPGSTIKTADKTEASTEKPATPESSKPGNVTALAEDKSPSSDMVIFRVQFLSSAKPRGSFIVKIGNNSYNSFEYFLNGSYRSCLGEFSSLDEAREFQKIMNQDNYPDAFVVAFRNNERVTDLRSLAQAQPQPDNRQRILAATGAAERSAVKESVEVPGPAQSQALTNGVVYRVQLSSYSGSKGSRDITIGGTTYKSFEYFFNGLYRMCVGEFGNLAQAREALKIIKQEGYPDAFVVAFVNNQRSLDPFLFR